MSDIGSHDPEALAQHLLPWLHDRLPDAERIILPPPRRPEGGGSSETLFLEPEIRERGVDRRETWVLRIEAGAYQIYQDPSVERQFRVMEALASTGSVPVPGMLWYEGDRAVLGAPFFVMERVDGRIPAPLYHSGGFLAELTPANRERVWLSAIETLARIDSVDVEPFRFLARADLGATGLEQEIAVWERYMTWSGAPLREVQETARLWLTDNLPDNRPTALAWGDARPGNMVFRNQRCVAVIDWETVSLAGAETDLGWWLFFDWLVSDGFGVARLPGLGSREETVHIWEGFAGRKALDMEWHEIFATWRFSLISDRARHLAKLRGGPKAPAPDARSPHAERLAMLLADQRGGANHGRFEVRGSG